MSDGTKPPYRSIVTYCTIRRLESEVTMVSSEGMQSAVRQQLSSCSRRSELSVLTQLASASTTVFDKGLKDKFNDSTPTVFVVSSETMEGVEELVRPFAAAENERPSGTTFMTLLVMLQVLPS